MAVVIRMKRTGRRNAPCYRISVADSRNPRDGRTLETLGLYDPISPVEDLRLRLDVERARFWVSQGAKPSHTVNSIFRRMNVYEGQPEPKTRTRDGRRKDTATAKRRQAAKAARAEAKKARQVERLAAKRAAAKAAEGESEGE
jgi:small subunit ribosomal protein S16